MNTAGEAVVFGLPQSFSMRFGWQQGQMLLNLMPAPPSEPDGRGASHWRHGLFLCAIARLLQLQPTHLTG